MVVSRRRFLGTALAAGAFPAMVRSAGDIESLRAAPFVAQLAPEDYPATPVWAYEGRVPGPEIRVRQGERVIRRLVNDLPQPTTIHWHGVRLANGMDGVPDLTQSVIPPGETFDYDFDVPDAGTFWYHPHHRTWEQLARGLSGALIVEERRPPETDADITLVISDWRLAEDASLHESFGALHDRAHGGRIGNWVTVNGEGNWSRASRRNERLRLRLINTANGRIFSLSLEGLAGSVVALDGMPLETPGVPGEIVLAPGQRVDLVLDVTAAEGGEATIRSRERDGTYVLAGFPVTGTARSAPLGPVDALPPNPVPALGDLAGARRATLAMEGGAMGRLEAALVDGARVPIREMAAQGLAWAMNGVASLPETPLLDVGLGETVHLAMANDTAWPHGMHLHGHHFREVRPGGAFGPLRDTLLVAPRSAAEIAFVADNPGDWLFHCHMVDHAASGMTTWIRVG